MGRDTPSGVIFIERCIFQSTLPAWGEACLSPVAVAGCFISIHSPRMGRDHRTQAAFLAKYISIHSPRMGRDSPAVCRRDNGDNFNPLSPHGERPEVRSHSSSPCFHFNPLSPHGERLKLDFQVRSDVISIHSPRMGRDTPCSERHPRLRRISIHSPRMGRDMPCKFAGRYLGHFNPLSPHGERPAAPALGMPERPISIHSPRMGRDPFGAGSEVFLPYFNPLSPHGERLVPVILAVSTAGFQSTLPAWGETRLAPAITPGAHNFNPLSPHGERRNRNATDMSKLAISIHSPRMGRDPTSAPDRRAGNTFQSTLPAWGET